MDYLHRELSEKIGYILRSQNKTLAVAESCTGGLIAHMLTEIPGASSYFLVSAVTYSVSAKMRILNISSEIIDKFGVVSQQIAEAMARNISSLAGADYALAITGNLGPSALEGKDVGLVYIALCESHEEVFTKELRLTDNRSKNKEKAAFEALSLLYERLCLTTSSAFC